MTLKLGRLSPDYMKPRLWLEDYMAVGLLPYQPWIDRLDAVKSWPMYLNDKFGCCTIAGMGHMYGGWTTYSGQGEALFADNVIEATYARNCPGFNPVTDQNDNGCVMSNVLQDQYVNGMADTTGKIHKIVAYAQIKSLTSTILAQALEVFGSVYVGVNLPSSALTQFENHQPWTYVRNSPIAGGHCISLQKCGTTSWPYTFISWGRPVQAGWEWVETYTEEAWVAISADWLSAKGQTIDGLNLAQLQADMAAI